MTPEEIRQLVERQARAWEMGDADSIAADFAPDGALISPGGRWQGPNELHRAVAATFEAVEDVNIEVTRVLLDGEQGAVEWTWSEKRKGDGRWYTMEDGIIFELENGKISYWREYFDPAGVEDPAR